MKINKPLTQEQLKQGDLIAPGIYDFQVMQASEKVSKSGNDMIELKIKIWLADGRERILFDYLLEAMEWKTGHFAECTGLFDKYQQGHLAAEECLGKSGQLKVYIQEGKNGYADKSAIADYLVGQESVENKEKTKPSKSDSDFQDDELPF